MIRNTGKTTTLIAALLLALCAAPMAGLGRGIDQQLNREADAARFAPAVLGNAVAAAELVERTSAPEAGPAQDALLPGVIRLRPLRAAQRPAPDRGMSLAAHGRARAIPIRAPPQLPL